MERVFLSFEKERFIGNILDVTRDNEGIIYSIYKQQGENEEVDYIDNNQGESSLYDDYYDSCVMFFSFNLIPSIRKKKILLKRINKALKKDGYMYIWDINSPIFSIKNKEIRAALPDRTFKDIKIKCNNLFTNNSKDKIIDIISNYFSIEEIRSCKDVYSLVCKRKDV